MASSRKGPPPIARPSRMLGRELRAWRHQLLRQGLALPGRQHCRNVPKPSVKSGTALAHLSAALAVTASLAMQYGCPAEVLARALPKLEDGSPADPLGRLLDLINAQHEGWPMNLANLPHLMPPMAAAAAEERARFAREITAAFARSRESIFEVGRLLIAAKATLAHGEWLSMIESDLPFKARYAQMLMKIASDQRLVNTKHASLLPISPSTLYEISKLSDAEFARKIEDGTIHPSMERRNIAMAVKAERREARELHLAKRIFALP